MAQPYRVGMLMVHGGTPRDQQAREELGAAVPDAEVTEADDLGVFEVELEAEDFEGALLRIWDGIAAAGVDDHILLLEHPDLPEHWRSRSAQPDA
jgi:hypothetical protein